MKHNPTSHPSRPVISLNLFHFGGFLEEVKGWIPGFILYLVRVEFGRDKEDINKNKKIKIYFYYSQY
jgi:hypothetical protein